MNGKPNEVKLGRPDAPFFKPRAAWPIHRKRSVKEIIALDEKILALALDFPPDLEWNSR